MFHFSVMVAAQASDPIKIIIILLIMYFIKKNRGVYIFIISGLLFGAANIWLVNQTTPSANINIILFMLASIISAFLLYGILLLFSGLRNQYLKLRGNEKST